MSDILPKSSGLFSIVKEPYKTVYRFLGLKWTRRYPLAELSDKLLHSRAEFRDVMSQNRTELKEALEQIHTEFHDALSNIEENFEHEKQKYVSLQNEITLLRKNLDYMKNPSLKTPIKYDGSNKIVIITENGETVVNPPFVEGLEVIMSGVNNKLTVCEPYSFVKAVINLSGDTDVLINKNCRAGAFFSIKKTRNTTKNRLIIGEDFQCGSNCTIDMTDAGDIFIGDDAKWSWNVYLKSDDTHPVFDIETKKCLNASMGIIIGRHVWIGMGVTILKNSEIKDESVIGAHAVVAKKFTESNAVIAGNPAAIRKRNINWSHGSISKYISDNG